MFQSYELKENMLRMKEDLLKCTKEVKKVDSVKRAGSNRSMGTRKRLRVARGSFFSRIASLRKEVAGKRETGANKTKKRSRRGEDEEAGREKEGETETGVLTFFDQMV